MLEVGLDWLAVGLDPEKSTYVVQSYIPEHAELAMLLSMLTPLGMLERIPTLKAERDKLEVESLSVGFYTYPVSQVADILLPKANLVPVGEDQLPHIEMTREVARRFNQMYCKVSDKTPDEEHVEAGGGVSHSFAGVRASGGVGGEGGKKKKSKSR